MGSLDGCPSFSRKARALPAIVDGDLVAITSDMEVHQLKKQTEQKKQQIKQRIEEEKKENMKLEEVSSFEKRKIVRNGLFMNPNRRTLFEEAKRG